MSREVLPSEREVRPAETLDPEPHVHLGVSPHMLEALKKAKTKPYTTGPKPETLDPRAQNSLNLLNPKP